MALYAIDKEFDKDFKVDTFNVDMSGYAGIKAVNHHFLGTTVSELKRTIDEKGSGIFYVGYVGCSWCQDCLRYLEEVAEELDVKIYYIDAYSEAYPVVYDKETFALLKEILDPLLKTDEDGEKVVFTPHVFTVINGQFDGSQISVPEDWEFGNPTQSQIDGLKAIYRKILEPFSY